MKSGLASQPQIKHHEFLAISELILRQAGIALAPHKRELVVARLSGRLRELGLRSFGDYYERVQEDAAELAQMVDRITTHETRFFRETRHFALLEDAPYARWRAKSPRHLRFLSAGCSTGEEPFSIAMSSRYHFPPEAGWTIEVVALDVSHGTVKQARTATWSIDRAKEIPDHYKKAFMLRGVGRHAHRMRATPELRKVVQFHVANLNDDSSRTLGVFDVIFCCNVLMYFDLEARKRAIRRVLDRLKPDGYLLLGHAESLTGFEEHVRCIAPNAYVRATSGGEPR
jgi:chemotaxis protein methyltransferase CheR